MTIPNDPSAKKRQWTHLRRVLERTGPFKDPNFEPSTEVLHWRFLHRLLKPYSNL